MATESKPRRLCSEIQLFDLCTKEKCARKDGKYCADGDMLAKFEAISEDDDVFQDQFTSDEGDDSEDMDNLEDEYGYREDAYDDDEEEED